MKDMENFARVVHKTRLESLSLLEQFVGNGDAETADAIDWTQPIEQVRVDIGAAMGGLSLKTRKKLEDQSERICLMAKSVGHEAARSLGKGVTFPGKDKLPDGIARMLWLYQNHREDFTHAEEARYAIEHRLSPRCYSAFAGPKGLTLNVKEDSKESFAEKIAALMKLATKDIAVSNFARTALSATAGADGDAGIVEKITLYQFTVAVNADADSFETVRNGKVEIEYFVPCNMIRMTYEPSSGTIEVYAPSTGMRREVARAFADTIMQHEIKGESIPLQHYDLELFREPRVFPAHGENISGVRVTQIKIERRHEAGEDKAVATKALYNTLDIRVDRHESRSIWVVAEADFKSVI